MDKFDGLRQDIAGDLPGSDFNACLRIVEQVFQSIEEYGHTVISIEDYEKMNHLACKHMTEGA